ncbi:class I SAM-dependent methyltransferase [Streptomyces goshikiensis]|uniref:class I SAM-dependent methyltransferase n=1 Tax=Streptomyces goshikiensis TaxID=1942 RepID=UPI0036ADD087
MRDQYAALAGSYGYGEIDEMAIRKYAVTPTFLRVLGPVDGAEIVDLACGTGTYTRLLLAHGAARAVGVDVSAAMIAQARALEPADGPRAEYRLDDVTSMAPVGEFDVVTAVFLLDHAADRRQLGLMCRTVAAHLRPGGRFEAVVPNPDFDFHGPNANDPRYGRTYEFGGSTRTRSAPQDGDIITVTLLLATPVTIRRYHWSARTYRQALADAGLQDVVFTPPQPTPEGIDLLGNDFWTPFTDNPPAVLVTARR